MNTQHYQLLVDGFFQISQVFWLSNRGDPHIIFRITFPKSTNITMSKSPFFFLTDTSLNGDVSSVMLVNSGVQSLS